jgi:hypothetical protein
MSHIIGSCLAPNRRVVAKLAITVRLRPGTILLQLGQNAESVGERQLRPSSALGSAQRALYATR